MPKLVDRKPNIVLLHWKQEEIGALAAGPLRELEVSPYVPNQGEGSKGLKSYGVPDILVISLDRLPSHGRDIGWHFHQQKATRQVPLVFAGGDPLKVAKIRELLPEAVYTNWDDAAAAVREALSKPKVDPIPKRKREVLSEAPLHAKIGLQEGMSIALIGAPAPLEELLPDLPAGIAVQEYPSAEKTAMTLWFVLSNEEFAEELPMLAKALGKKPRLWVFYRKGRGMAWTGLLELAGRHGLAQFKVMRLNETWSGVAFGRARNV
jgi:hypothetical protein